jgi:hypothetical protein
MRFVSDFVLRISNLVAAVPRWAIVGSPLRGCAQIKEGLTSTHQMSVSLSANIVKNFRTWILTQLVRSRGLGVLAQGPSELLRLLGRGRPSHGKPVSRVVISRRCRHQRVWLRASSPWQKSCSARFPCRARLEATDFRGISRPSRVTRETLQVAEFGLLPRAARRLAVAQASFSESSIGVMLSGSHQAICAWVRMVQRRVC